MAKPSFSLIDEEQLSLLQDEYRSGLDLSGKLDPRLGGVLSQTLATPGSFIRAQLAYQVSRNLGESDESARETGILVEYFHTASLILDDLPSMDNAMLRRGESCVHRTYGVGHATLGALALINRAYALLWKIMARHPQTAHESANLVEECLGHRGILNGQARDLNYRVSRANPSAVQEIALDKTASLLVMALVLPAVIQGAASHVIDALRQLAHAWGLAYQCLDDFKDLGLAARPTGKTHGRDEAGNRPNIVGVIGAEPALAYCRNLLTCSTELISFVASDESQWQCLNLVQQQFQADYLRLSYLMEWRRGDRIQNQLRSVAS